MSQQLARAEELMRIASAPTLSVASLDSLSAGGAGTITMRQYRMAGDRGRLFGQLVGQETWKKTKGELMKAETSAAIERQIREREELVAKLMEQREGKAAARTRRKAARQERRNKRNLKNAVSDPTFLTLQQLMQLEKEEEMGEVCIVVFSACFPPSVGSKMGFFGALSWFTPPYCHSFTHHAALTCCTSVC
jgi:hypothetical protein